MDLSLDQVELFEVGRIVLDSWNFFPRIELHHNLNEALGLKVSILGPWGIRSALEDLHSLSEVLTVDLRSLSTAPTVGLRLGLMQVKIVGKYFVVKFLVVKFLVVRLLVVQEMLERE